MTLPANVIREDHNLEAAAERTGEALARHRWHWTLDETNADRVGFGEYGRAVGRNLSTIRTHAHGYAAWQAEDGSPLDRRPLYAYIERASMGADRQAAAEAVAEATGRTFGTVARDPAHRREVADVVNAARERAERKGTTVADEIPRVVEFRASAQASREAQRQRRAAQHTLQYIAVSGRLGRAVQDLRAALDEADGVTFNAEELDLLTLHLARTRSVLDLVALRITGSTDIDWDAALAKLADSDEHDAAIDREADR